jgi:hypothetical protein
MQVTFSPDDLKPLIEEVISATLKKLTEGQAAIGERLAISEPEAAHLLSLEPHQLRDERLRGRITASRIVGRRIRYARQDLMDYLAKNRINISGREE